jgi:hypothetical protein
MPDRKMGQRGMRQKNVGQKNGTTGQHYQADSWIAKSFI